MRATGILLVVLSAAVWGQVTAEKHVAASPQIAAARAATVPTGRPLISRSVLGGLEKGLDNKLATAAGPNDPIDVMEYARGLYLKDYGVVFTSLVSLIVTPRLSPFLMKITDEMKVSVHKRKMDHLPMLKKAMQDMLMSAAKSLDVVPPDEQIVVAVRLWYEPWEDTAGLPAQILMKADRKSALAGSVQTEEQ